MVKRGTLFILVLLFAPLTHAQTQVFLGFNGGIDFNNTSIGGQFGIRAPLGRTEFGTFGTFSPFETHTGGGSGVSSQAQIGEAVWLTRSFGIDGSVEFSQYHVTQFGKTEYFAHIGPVFRFTVGGFPSRIYVHYDQEIHNRIAPDGTESNYVKGATFILENMLGCTSKFCVLMVTTIDGGHLLLQANPANDSPAAALANGQTYHPRIGANGGGFQFGVRLRFPYRRGDEEKVY